MKLQYNCVRYTVECSRVRASVVAEWLPVNSSSLVAEWLAINANNLLAGMTRQKRGACFLTPIH